MPPPTRRQPRRRAAPTRLAAASAIAAPSRPPSSRRVVGNATINDRLSAIGTGRANNSVVVTPYSSGTLTEIKVTPGSMVEAGSVIAQARFRHRGDRRRPRQVCARRRAVEARARQRAEELQHGHHRAGEGRRVRRRECAPRAARRRAGAAAPLDHRRRSAASSASSRSRPATPSPTRRRSPWSTTVPRSSSTSGCRSASRARWLSARRCLRRRSPGPRMSSRAW